jgi:hypothetical protein
LLSSNSPLHPNTMQHELKACANLAVLALCTAIAVALARLARLVVLKFLRGSAKPNLKAKWGVLVATSLASMGVPMAKQFK